MRWKIVAVAIAVSLSVLVCLRPGSEQQVGLNPAAERFEPVLPATLLAPARERGRRCPPINVAPSCTIPADLQLLYRRMDRGRPLPEFRLPK